MSSFLPTKKIIRLLSIAIVILNFKAYSQCTLPGGSIPITSSFNLTTIAGGTTYYVPAGTVVNLNYSAIGSLTVNGTIIIQDNALLKFNFGGNSFTINNTIKLCQGAALVVDTLHSINFSNAASQIDVGPYACVIFSHLVNNWNPNQGVVKLNDYSSFEMIDYHNFNNADLNLFSYTGSGTTAIGVGNPLVHFGATNYASYPSINNAAKNLTASNKIDIVNDNPVGGSGDKPGAANYCGPRAFSNSLACRSANWPALGLSIDAACYYQNQTWLLAIEKPVIAGFPKTGWNEINWILPREVTITSLSLEKSNDGQSFNRVMELGTNSGQHNQSGNFIDKQLNATTSFYRVKIIKANGEFVYSSTISISNKITAKSSYISGIYPNPFIENIFLNVYAENSNSCKIRVMDLSGKIITTYTKQLIKGNNNIKVDGLKSLVRGIYVLEINTGEQAVLHYKIEKL